MGRSPFGAAVLIERTRRLIADDGEPAMPYRVNDDSKESQA